MQGWEGWGRGEALWVARGLGAAGAQVLATVCIRCLLPYAYAVSPLDILHALPRPPPSAPLTPAPLNSTPTPVGAV